MPVGMAQLNYTQNQQPNNQTGAPNISGEAGSEPAARPFKMAAQRHIEIGSTHNLPGTSWVSGVTDPYEVPTGGYLRGVEMTYIGSSGAKGATVTVAGGADAPFNLLSSISLTDANSTPIIQLDGYALYLAMLLGGYFTGRPDQSTYGFTPIDGTAAGGTGSGNFKIKYFLPIEFGVDGLGSLANMDGSAKYKINTTFNSPANFFNGAAQQPATLPNITTVLTMFGYSNPPATDQQGTPNITQPPALGSVGYWTSENQNVIAGDNTIFLHRVGNKIRNHILVFRDASGVRSAADSSGVTPSTIEFKWDSFSRYVARVDTLRQMNYEQYLFDVPAGVIVLPNTTDPDGLPGHEYGLEWMSTLGSSTLQLKFTSSAAGSLQIISNDIVPASNAIYAAPAMSL